MKAVPRKPGTAAGPAPRRLPPDFWPRSVGTRTTAGFFHHLHLRLHGQRILAPVRILREGEYTFPERRDGKLVYVLPGGTEVLA